MHAQRVERTMESLMSRQGHVIEDIQRLSVSTAQSTAFVDEKVQEWAAWSTQSVQGISALTEENFQSLFEVSCSGRVERGE
jgi:hypothetical protein